MPADSRPVQRKSPATYNDLLALPDQVEIDLAALWAPEPDAVHEPPPVPYTTAAP